MIERLRGIVRGIGSAAAGAARAVGEALVGAGHGIGRAWSNASVEARRRVVAGVLAVVGIVLVATVVWPRLPCQLPGGDTCPPPDDASAIVPADTVGYLHLTVDEGSDQYEKAAALIESLPQVSGQLLAPVLAQVPTGEGNAADFERDLAPWLGEQAALALLPVEGETEQVFLFQEGDAEGAAEYADSLHSDGASVEEIEGTEVTTDSRGLATASVDGFLAIGTAEGVRRVVEVAAGAEGTRPLADDDVVAELRDDLPAERFADAFISEDGIQDLIANENGPLASAEPFVDAAASRGVAASLGATDDSLELAIRSSLDPERARTNPGFFSAFPGFEPALPELLAEGTLGYVGIGDPGTTVSELFAQASAEAPLLAEGLTNAVEALRESGNVNIQDQLLPSLGGEAAFALQPGGQAQEGEDEPAADDAVPLPPDDGLPQGPAPDAEEAPVPVLQFVADGVDTERARQALARLQGPIAEALDPGTSLQAPVFDSSDFQGVELQVLRLSPTVKLTYALADDNLAVASQPEGVEQVITGSGGLEDAEPYEDATSDLSDEPSLLAYFNLSELVQLAEREGLAEDPVYALIASEVRRLAAAGLAVDAAPTTLGTDARLVIAPEEEDADEPESTSGD